MENKKILKKVFTLFLAVLVTMVGIAPTTLGPQEAYAAAKVKYTGSVSKASRVIKVTSGALNNWHGACIDIFHSYKGNGSATYTKIANNTKMARVAYYAVKNGKFSDTGGSYSGEPRNTCNATVWYRAMQYARCKDGYKTSKSDDDALKAMRNTDKFSTTFTNKVKNAYTTATNAVSAAPDYFEIYYLNPDTSGTQDMVVWKLYSPGNATLKKSGSNSLAMSLSGYNNFSGVKYTLYKDNKSTAVGTFTAYANGTSNNITGLAPGTYYAKETTANAYYKVNPNWIGPITVKSNSTTTVSATDDPVTGSAQVIKTEKNGRDIKSGATFTFHFVNTQNSSVNFDITVTGNGTATASGTKTGVLAGTYNITETVGRDDISKRYTDATGRGTCVIPPNGTGIVRWANELTDYKVLNVSKTTDDGGVLEGFAFKVTGILYNEGTINAAKILEVADPSVTITDTENYNNPTGNWTVDPGDLSALNAGAKNRETGEYTVRLTKTATHKLPSSTTAAEIVEAIDPIPTEAGDGQISSSTVIKNGNKYYKAKEDVAYAYAFKEDDNSFDAEATAANITALLTGNKFEELDLSDLTITANVKIELKDVTYNAEADEYVAKTDNPDSTTVTEDAYTLTFNNFDWRGAATVYREVRPNGTLGNEYTQLRSKESGEAYMQGADQPGIHKGITYGKFTVEELLTPEQAKRYKQLDPQTQEITDSTPVEDIAYSFQASNIAKRSKVKLKKIDPAENIANVQFSLTGTTNYGEEVGPLQATTDSEGNIDFGLIPAGKYVIEETSFDKTKYVNNHPLSGYTNPAIEITVTGEEEDGELVVEFENKPITELKIAKVDGETYDFLENAEFELYEDNELAAKFQIVRNDDGSAGVNMIWSNGEITGTMSKTIIDEDGELEQNSDDIVVGDEDANENTDDDSDDDSDDPSDEPDDDQPEGDDQTQENIDFDSLNWATLKGLKYNSEYVLKETKAPKGYIATSQMPPFIYNENPKRIAVLNYIPEIGTVAYDSETNTHSACADNEVTIIDTVEYKHLVPGEKYVLKGSLNYVPNDDESQLDIEPLMDGGKKVVETKEFTAKNPDNPDYADYSPEKLAKELSEDISFTFNGSELAGKSIVAFEECYEYAEDGSLKLIASHDDPVNLNQTITFPEIGTEAKDAESVTGLGCLKEEQTIKDTVSCSNLEPNKTYKMKANLYDKQTGELLKDDNGEVYTFEKEFTADESGSGTEEVTLTINSTKLMSHQVVAFEECYTTGDVETLIAFHKDPEDPKQTIEYPDPKYDMYKIRVTDASQKKNTDKYGFKPGDTVYYEVHVENKGNCPITMDVRDEFSEASLFTLPVVEKVENATQNSISENKNVANITIAKGEKAIVTYSATALPGTPEYLANAAKDSDSKNNDADVNKTQETNTPDNNDGYVNTAYTENPTYPDPSNPDNPLPVPEGPKDDPAQTPIRAPKIGTYLTGKANKKDIGPDKKTTLVDTVAYSGLTPGQKYAVVGTLMVKDKGNPLVEDGEKVVATGTFTPTQEEGSTAVKFTVNTSKLQGKELVAFEVCYNVSALSGEEMSTPEAIAENGIKVASHEDLKDKAQTIKVKVVKKTKKSKKKPKTGEDYTVLFLGGAFFIAAVSLMIRRRKTAKK